MSVLNWMMFHCTHSKNNPMVIDNDNRDHINGCIITVPLLQPGPVVPHWAQNGASGHPSVLVLIDEDDLRTEIWGHSFSPPAPSYSVSALPFPDWAVPLHLQVNNTLKLEHLIHSTFYMVSLISTFHFCIKSTYKGLGCRLFLNLLLSWEILVFAPKKTFFVFSSFSAICCLSCSSLFLPSQSYKKIQCSVNAAIAKPTQYGF